MPKPLPEVFPDARFELANVGGVPIPYNPHLTVLAMQGIAAWALVEHRLLDLYIALAGGSATKAGAVFLALQGRAAKSAALKALSEFQDERRKHAIQVSLRASESAGKLRNKIAHWVWGFSPDVPDALLVANPLDLIKNRDSGDVRDLILVYKQQDFEDIITQCTEAALIISKVADIIAETWPRKEDRQFELLMNRPAYRDSVNRKDGQA